MCYFFLFEAVEPKNSIILIFWTLIGNDFEFSNFFAEFRNKNISHASLNINPSPPNVFDCDKYTDIATIKLAVKIKINFV